MNTIWSESLDVSSIAGSSSSIVKVTEIGNERLYRNFNRLSVFNDSEADIAIDPDGNTTRRRIFKANSTVEDFAEWEYRQLLVTNLSTFATDTDDSDLIRIVISKVE